MATSKAYDFVGKEVNGITVLRILEERASYGSLMTLSKCKCGKEFKVSFTNLWLGRTKSCGCICRSIDRTITRYGDLEILSFLGIKDNQNKELVSARCLRCLSVRNYRLERLRIGASTSCKCGKVAKHTAFSSLTPSSLYWMGMLGSDGNVYENRVCLDLHESDHEHVQLFCEFVGLGNTSKTFYRDSVRFYVYSRVMAIDLANHGITKSKSLNYSPSKECAHSSDFWRGMIDGDGSLTWRSQKVPSIVLYGSFDTCYAFVDWVDSIVGWKYKIGVRGNIGVVTITGERAIKLGIELYGKQPEYFLKRKYDMFMSFLNKTPKRNKIDKLQKQKKNA